MSNAMCSINDSECSAPGSRITHDWCMTHYKRWIKYGDTSGAPVEYPSPLPGENWRDVPEYEGLYQVSDLGRIWSFRRKGSKGHFLKAWLGNTGYPTVTLSRNDMNEHWPVHRLVGEAFIGPLPPGWHTRHGAAGPLDPSLANICYGTPTQNEEDKVRDGTTNRRERNGMAKLTEAEVLELRDRYGAGESARTLGEEFGLSGTYVSQLADGTRWGLPAVQRTATAYVRGERQPCAKLTAEIVIECRGRRTAGETYYALAQEFGVTRAAMREAVLGVTWKHVA
jgi:NUMOD4 motif